MKLDLDAVAKSFGPHQALSGVSFAVKDARCLVFIGPSGGGKSTLLRILGGLEPRDSGDIRLDGQPLPADEPGLLAYRRTVGTVFQTWNLFPHLTALENLTLPLEKVHGHAHAAAVAIAREHLSRFQLSAHADKTPAQLSGGQRQRVAIARALSIRPRLLLFDEPTSALDPEMTAEVLEAIEQLRGEGRDLVLVTHAIAFARRVADHVVFLAAGRVGEHGPAGEIFSEPREQPTRDFLARVLRY